MGSGGSKNKQQEDQEQPTETETAVEDDVVDADNVEETRDDNPPPYIPEKSRDDVCDPVVTASIHDHVVNRPMGTDSSYSSLLNHLREGASTQAQQVTAIYLWMKCQDYEDPCLDRELGGDSPRGYMKRIKQGQGDYTSFFTILCRRADIPCTIIRGVGKDDTFYVGRPHGATPTKWAAVYVDDEWRLAHVHWAMEARDPDPAPEKKKDDNNNNNNNTNDEEVVADKNAKNKNKKKKKGAVEEVVEPVVEIVDDRQDRKDWTTDNSQVSDFFFLTDPAKFAVLCSPDDFRWQLLNQAYSRKQFMALPNFRPSFFNFNANNVDPKTGTIRTTKSKTEIAFSFPKKSMDNIRLTYKYYFLEPLHVKPADEWDSDDDEDRRRKPDNVPNRLANYVFVDRKPSKFVFEIFLPAAGKYLFDISGVLEDDNNDKGKGKGKGKKKGHNKKKDKGKKNDNSDETRANGEDHSDETQANGEADPNDTYSVDSQDEDSDEEEEDKLERICQFRLIAEQDPDPLEIETNPDNPEIGWGPGPRCRDLGLVPVSHHEGCINTKPYKEVEVKFEMTRKVEVMTQLVHEDKPIYELVEMVDCRTKRKDVTVTVTVPDDDRYALKIYSREPGTKEFQEACVYLLKPRVPPRLNDKYRDRMLRSRLEHHVVEHTSEQELVDAIDMHECYYVPDQGEKEKGYEKVKQYWEIKRELDISVKGRNHSAIEKWLDRAKRSPYRPDLQDDIDRGEMVLERVNRRKGYMHPIAKLDQHSIHEIRQYNDPPGVIRDVMQSTYMLLGERQQDVQSWEQIQWLMCQQGREGLQRRIVTREKDDVSSGAAKEADRNIDEYSLDKCRETSTNIGAFYKWCKQFCRDVEQRDMDDRERAENDRSRDGRETYRNNSRPSSRDSRRSRSRSRDSRRSGRDSRRSGRDSRRGSRQSNDRRSRSPSPGRRRSRSPTPERRFQPQKPHSSKKQGAVSYQGFKQRN